MWLNMSILKKYQKKYYPRFVFTPKTGKNSLKKCVYCVRRGEKGALIQIPHPLVNAVPPYALEGSINIVVASAIR